MNATSLISMANKDLEYITGEIDYVNAVFQLTQNSKSGFIRGIYEILQHHKQSIEEIAERYLCTKEVIRKRAFEDICNINTDQLPMDDKILNQIRNHDRQILRLNSMNLHTYVNWYLNHYDISYDECCSAQQKIARLCDQVDADAHFMKISFNTYVVHKYEKGKIK